MRRRGEDATRMEGKVPLPGEGLFPFFITSKGYRHGRFLITFL